MSGEVYEFDGEIAEYDPQRVGQLVRWSEQVQSLLPPDGYYFIIVAPDGSRQIAYTEQEAERLVAKTGGMMIRELTRKGLLMLALATSAQVVPTQVATEMTSIGNFIVQTTRSDYETMVVWLRATDLQPVAAFCNVVVSNGRVTMPGTGAAFASERRFVRPGDIIALAETRAVNRALEGVLGGGSVSEGYEAAPPKIPDNLDQVGFIRIITQAGVTIAEALARLGVSSLTDIKDFAAAARQVLGLGVPDGTATG